MSEAVQHLKSALHSARAAHDRTLTALVLSRLGVVCNRGGKYTKAVSLFKETLRTVAAGGAEMPSPASAAPSRASSSFILNVDDWWRGRRFAPPPFTPPSSFILNVDD